MAHDRHSATRIPQAAGRQPHDIPSGFQRQKAALNVADYAVNFGPDLWMPFNTVSAQWATARFAEYAT